MRYALSGLFVLAFAGCGVMPDTSDEADAPGSVAEWMAGEAPPAPPSNARTVEQFDTTTEEQRVAASAPAAGGALLGREIVSLGDPSRPGFWIETALVNAPGQGRLVFAQTGKSVEVELIPGEGGARVSLAALRLLEAPLTELPMLEVYQLN